MSNEENQRAGLSRGTIVVLALGGGFAPFAIDAYVPGLDQIAHEFDVSASVAQLSLTGFLVTMGLAQLLIGPLSDQRGRRRLLLIGLGGSVIASIVAAMAPSILVLIIARMLQGFFGAAGVVLSKAIIADLGRGVGVAKAFSTLMAVQSIAPVIAPAIGGFLVPAFGWRSVFVFLAILAFGTLIGAYWMVPETLPEEARNTNGFRKIFGSMGKLLTEPPFLFTLLMFVSAFAVMFSYIAGSSFIMIRLNGFSTAQYSVMFTINSATLVIANLLNSRIVTKVPVLKWVSIVTGVMGAAVLWILVTVLVFDAAAIPLMIGFFILVGSNGFLFPNTVALAMQASEGRTGSGSALLGAFQFTFAAGIAPLTGVGDGSSALPMALVMTVGAAILAGGVTGLRAVTSNAQKG
ncbi:multidrug effflux MFS transporter [Corynebacterium auriscanis]|uniref:multidrug effflux MFS transporter n=1 Tax=Corynebacterium auriscanis TaxID=99807 RepID=UPI002247F706|nr:multidrug effflux MFS transporter [Corynebacterium auriscanis]MCX2164173.1 multidrug effflux MFS transporter [Corynebacterium auriscanis]